MPRAKLSQAGYAIPNPIFADPTGRRRVALVALSAASALLLAFLAYDFIARVHYLHLEHPRMEISVEEPAPASSTPPPMSIVMNDGPDGACGEEGRKAESEPIVAAYLKAGDNTAYSALVARCRQLDLVLAEAVNLISPNGSVALLSDKARPLSELVEDGAFQVLPVLGVGPGLSGPELTAFLNSSDDVSRLRSRINLLRDGAFANGLCLDLSRHGNLPSTTVDSALRSLGAGADPICLIAPADADYWKDASLVAGLDIAVVQGFRASANPGEPPARESWFTTSIDEVLADIPPEKLIVALETSGHSWQSGRPGERQLSYAETLHELVENSGTFSFRPETGTAKFRYVDTERKLNETWLFDAVSFNNQLAHLGAERSVAIWSLGYEDPGVWELLDQSHGSRVLREEDDLGHVLRIEGAGALVVDVVPARQGLRVLDREEMTGRIIGQPYDVFPTPSRLRRTEREFSAGLAVTFQGIPSRDTAAQLLGLLEHHGIEATFFVDVPALLPAGDVTSALVQAGHHIGLHTGEATHGPRELAVQ